MQIWPVDFVKRIMLSMKMETVKIEVPLEKPSLELLERSGPLRLDWTEGAVSLPPVLLGTLTDTGRFSEPINLAQVNQCQDSAIAEVAADDDLERFNSVNLELPFRIERLARLAIYNLPARLEQFAEALGIIAAHEHTITNANARGSAKLSIEQTFVKAGDSQRGNSRYFHRDGSGTTSRHIYVVADRYPTLFYPTTRSTRANYITPRAINLLRTVRAHPYQVAFAHNSRRRL
jgi:hypothetical protein